MKKNTKKYFGTDGFRGEANKVLTAEHAFKIGRYLGWYYDMPCDTPEERAKIREKYMPGVVEDGVE